MHVLQLQNATCLCDSTTQPGLRRFRWKSRIACSIRREI